MPNDHDHVLQLALIRACETIEVAQVGFVPARKTINFNGQNITLQISPGTPLHQLPPIEQAIYNAASETPQTMKQLAKASHKKLNSYFSSKVKSLIARGLLHREDGGICR